MNSKQQVVLLNIRMHIINVTLKYSALNYYSATQTGLLILVSHIYWVYLTDTNILPVVHHS